MEKDAINATARWEVYVPNWNKQSVFISGSSDCYSNSTSKNIEVKNGQLKLNEWQLQLSGNINEDDGVWSASAKNLDMGKVIQLLPKELIPSSRNLNLDGNLDLNINAISNFSGTSINAKGNWTNGYLNINDSYFIADNMNTQIIYSNGKLNSFETSAKLVVMDSMLSNVLLIIDRFSVKVFSIIVAELFTAFIAEVKTSIDSLIFS